jgi:hypothetical protein
MEVIIVKLWWLWMFLGCAAISPFFFLLKTINFFNKLLKRPEVDGINFETYFILALFLSVVSSVFWGLFIYSMKGQFFFSLGFLAFFIFVVLLALTSQDYKKQIQDIQEKRKKDRGFPVSELHDTQFCAVIALTIETFLALVSFFVFIIGVRQTFGI